MKIFIFGSLFLGFLFLFRQTALFARLDELIKRTCSDMDCSARQRNLEGRKRLITLQEEHTVLWFLEKQMRYSGIKQRFPNLTAEWWIVGNLLLLGILFVTVMSFCGLPWAFMACLLLLGAEQTVLSFGRQRNLRRVNENLLKLLDFLGNYSVTAGEVTGVLGQVSRYMEEPIRGALESFCAEAGMTGDTGLALLSMAEWIEHPKFKELARNMEISVRYCADFSAMVSSSRRSMREYLRVLQERKGMLREAWINMLLLLTMSVVMLTIVGKMIGFPLWPFLWKSLPGKIALAVVALILGLFAGQAGRIQV